jgi:putative spermidine/putrescine transport system substrate-binding protein
LEKGVWAKIDPGIVTNYADLYPQTRQPEDAGIPIGGLSEGIFYRPEEMQKLGWPIPHNWLDLYRTEYCGRLAMSHPNSSDGLRTLIMLADGKTDGVPAVIDKLAANKRCYPVLETTSPKLEEKAKIGEYFVGTINSIRAIPLIHSGVPIKFFIPKEGTIESFSIAAPVKGGPADAKLVQKFLNWFIDAGVQKQLMEILAYSPTNAKVVVPQDLAEMGVLDSEGMKHVIKIDSATIDKLRRNWARRVDRAWSN